ncbi:MAG: ABC transporter permease [Myxococcota bacterium]|nr:ABC transporter permease [Myxococcota bacterium]MDW8363184.1 ABC transporter permease [Myxococcales bacterium]
MISHPWRVPGVARLERFFGHVGGVTQLLGRALRALLTRRLELRETLRQIEQLGVRSVGIAMATAIFTGVVMGIQFAFSLEKFGAKDSVGRIVLLSFARELAPSLTALVVGARVGAGIAAELGSMRVTEQIDAIRALGADPVRKLVVPRLLACVFVLPMLSAFAFVCGTAAAMLVCNVTFGVPMPFFVSSGLDSVTVRDFASGIGKTPFFGAIIALVGCHFGLVTEGGTEGVGRATTSAVVSVCIAVLVADALLTQIFLSL